MKKLMLLIMGIKNVIKIAIAIIIFYFTFSSCNQSKSNNIYILIQHDHGDIIIENDSLGKSYFYYLNDFFSIQLKPIIEQTKIIPANSIKEIININVMQLKPNYYLEKIRNCDSIFLVEKLDLFDSVFIVPSSLSIAIE